MTCVAPCNTCTSLVDCISCIGNTYLIPGLSICVSKVNCPITTYPDDNLGQCAKCDISCETCYGPTPDECKTCMISLGYAEKMTTGPGPCQKVICPDGQYINITKTNALCLPCDPKCDICVSKYPTLCTKCKNEFQEVLADNGQVKCLSCTDFLGMKKGVGKNCEGKNNMLTMIIEICGDGRHMGLLECDDGNLQNGDGCSSLCIVEANYVCYGGTANSPDKCNSSLPLVFTSVEYFGNTSL